MNCLVGCRIDECGYQFCPACEPDHVHTPRLATGRLDPDRYLMPQAEEQRVGSAMVATLSTPGQAR
eukprot:3882255-Alexandrium_andersonii.AAC.1